MTKGFKPFTSGWLCVIASGEQGHVVPITRLVLGTKLTPAGWMNLVGPDPMEEVHV
jgi:hypothetical protein